MVLIKYSGKYVKIYFNMKITYSDINSYSEDASAFPGQSGVQTVPEPPQPHDKIHEREEP